MSSPPPKSNARGNTLEYQLLLTATLCLLALGAVMVFSASSATGVLDEDGNGGFYYLQKIVIFGAIGLLVMRYASIKGARVTRAMTPLAVGVSLFLLVCVLVPGVGVTVNGAQSWVGGGFLTFQPSELAKFSLILYGAHLLAQRPKMTRDLRSLGPYLLVVGMALGLILLQPDLGTAMTTTLGVTALLIVAGVQPRTLMPIAVVGAIAVVGMLATHPYQLERVTGFLNPGADVDGAGYQTRQAEIALGSGGAMGVGLGESVQKASYLPEAHTDMVSAVLGEETGLIGMAGMILLFLMFGYAGMKAAHRAKDRYGKLLAAGLTSMILTQATINLFAVMGLAPLTGVPLPFVSYGGTSLIVTLASAGLIMNVARRQSGAKAATGTAKPTRRAPATSPRRGARLRSVEGGRQSQRRRPAASTSRHSGGRNGGARRAGHSGRRRASR